MPDLCRIDAMPVRALAACEGVVDGGPGSAFAGRSRCAPGLAVPAAFRMRPEVERADDGLERLRLVGAGHALKLFFRSRTSFSVATASPRWPTKACSAGSSERRKGLARFSLPIVVGTVGMFFARFWS